MASTVTRVDSRSTFTSSNASPNSSSIWTKPTTSGYRISELLSFPKRVISPPPAGLPMLATVGSLTLRPSYEVKIDDMLAAKYLPPLGLRDFEEWLVFTEHSAENLYFVQWLKEYTTHYTNGTWTDSQLWFSFLRAKASFFVPNGTHELNLPSSVVREIAAISMSANGVPTPPDAKHKSDGTSVTRPPSPSALADAEKNVRRMLSNSLTKFASEATSNAGVLRRFYCGSVGLFAACLGLLPVLFSILGGYNRFIRLAAFPPFWLGSIIMLCAYARVCLVIYFWGDFRQLRGYELDMPSISALAPHASEGDAKQSSESKETYPPPTSAQQAPATASTGKSLLTPASPYSSAGPAASYPYLHTTADEQGEGEVIYQRNDIEAQDTNTPAIVLNLPPRNPPQINGAVPAHPLPRRAPPVPITLARSPATVLGFDWDALPPPIHVEKKAAAPASPHKMTRKSFTSLIFASDRPNSPTSSVSISEMGEKITPIFAPLTKVVNPLIVRGMAEIVRRSTLWGAIFGAFFTAIVFVVPFHGHGWGDKW